MLVPARPYREPSPVEPDPVPQQSEAARLGSLRSVHAPPPLRRALLGPILIAALIVAIGAAGGASRTILVALAAVTLAILAWEPLRNRGWSAALHAQGLVLLRRGTRRVVTFDDVNEVWYEIRPIHNQAGAYLGALRLVDYSGEEHRLPLAVNDGGTLAISVLRECSGPLLVEARRALGEGEVLTFGKIQLDRAGITVGGARMMWGEIRLAVVSHARVRLYRRFPIMAWRTIRLDRIPNPGVFVGLVEQCAAKTRVDDPLLVPFTSGDEKLRAQAAQGDNEWALREMLVGGLFCVAGIAFTLATYSAVSNSYILAWGAILFGAFRFYKGLASLLRGPRL
ncbi:hypothetical protein BE15_05190 [Sorangium cellulosum]|uniref:Uncharacterized protein n=1 Tax=Sorangium cellulosum TaxID=56 RepID=A0A150QRH2_SORCE|nr:hypothetical protein BE15_05190 [Sorangium cellulosum]